MGQQALARNNVKVFGAGASSMLFAPGFGCDQTMWRFVAPAFADRYQIVLLDYVGFGSSNRQSYSVERYGDLRGYAEDVLDVCRALALNDVIFVGHSISGMIGLLASLSDPARFARLVLIGASACYINDPPGYVGGFDRDNIHELLDLMERNYTGWASFLAPLVMKNAGRPELAQELEESFRASDEAIARAFAAVTFLSDNRAILAQVTVPSLLIQCLEDIMVPPEAADFLHEHLPLSTCQPLHAVGHYPHLSNPAETIRVIEAYLQAPATPAAAPPAAEHTDGRSA
jgi:sigma-B regulation protein RsbQ